MIEAVQRRAARFVTNTYIQSNSVTAMLFRLGWPSLVQRREIAKTIMMYKILWQLYLINTGHLLLLSYTRGHSQRFHQVAAHVNAYLCSFFPPTIKLWNSLVIQLSKESSVEEFQKLIQSYYLCIVFQRSH